MKVEQRRLYDVIGYNDKVLGIVENVIDRMEKPTYDELIQAMDDELIYYEDQWEIMKHYQLPQEANLQSAWEELFNDISIIVGGLTDD